MGSESAVIGRARQNTFPQGITLAWLGCWTAGELYQPTLVEDAAPGEWRGAPPKRCSGGCPKGERRLRLTHDHCSKPLLAEAGEFIHILRPQRERNSWERAGGPRSRAVAGSGYCWVGNRRLGRWCRPGNAGQCPGGPRGSYGAAPPRPAGKVSGSGTMAGPLDQILVAGASSVIGRREVPLRRRHGYEVIGTTRYRERPSSAKDRASDRRAAAAHTITIRCCSGGAYRAPGADSAVASGSS